MLFRSLKPGNGKRLGVPPVARMSLVYDTWEPDFVDMDLLEKSTEVTVSEMISTDALEYHSLLRIRILSTSGIRALDNFVRSIGRLGSLLMRVIDPL